MDDLVTTVRATSPENLGAAAKHLTSPARLVVVWAWTATQWVTFLNPNLLKAEGPKWSLTLPSQ